MNQKSASRRKPLTFKESLKKIEIEYTLINHRMTWLLISQGFLLTGYFSARSLNATETIRAVLLPIIATVGLLLSAIISLSIFAAFAAIRRWRSEAAAAQRNKLTSHFKIHFFGNWPAATTGFAIMLLWMGIMYADRPFMNSPEGLSYIGFASLMLLIPTVVWGILAWTIFNKIVPVDPPDLDESLSDADESLMDVARRIDAASQKPAEKPTVNA